MNKGKRQIIQLLNRNVVASVTMMRIVQIACFVASILVVVLGIWKLTTSDLSGAQIVFGLLSSSLGPLLFLGIGVFLPMVVTSTEDNQAE